MSRRGRAELLGALLVLGLRPAPAEPERVHRTWAGHQVVFGQRRLPMLGTQTTRTDTYVLAEVVETGATIELRERPCRIEMAEVAGARVRFPAGVVERLPEVVVRFLRAGPEWSAGPWISGFDAGDLDEDGHPGVTLEVEAPLCGGRLHVASAAESIARATRDGEGLRGALKVRLHQTILGAEGACLSALAGDSDERLSGTFRYAPVPEGTRCEDLGPEAWPSAGR